MLSPISLLLFLSDIVTLTNTPRNGLWHPGMDSIVEFAMTMMQ